MPRARSHEPAAGETRSASTGSNYHTQALTRGLQLLELFSSSRPPVTFIEIHENSGLPKSTLVRLLSALTEADFITKIDERPAYRLGHKVLTLADAYVSSLDISDLAGDYLDTLATVARQTANIGVLDGTDVLHVCVRTPNRPLRFEQPTGARSPAYCAGLGKALLAALDAAELPAHLPPAPYPRYTDRTITTQAELDAELRRTKRRGYAVDDNENSVGLRCVAVTLSHEGETLGALSVSGPSGEFGQSDQRRYVEALSETAEKLMSDPDVVAVLRRIHDSLRGSVTPQSA